MYDLPFGSTADPREPAPMPADNAKPPPSSIKKDNLQLSRGEDQEEIHPSDAELKNGNSAIRFLLAS
ncbi:Hypothetical protein SMAX5B_020577 [Scophthalmus maximus]|uniref:Uncharacterized protein n=1 Tax=Scophthalmus maximus TaxID=52904 RepID=A0A2U9CQM6_SCOMX|nr:Hypothetical protein SMAX5B_020577 [Scophthalmus maximus]